MYQLATQSAIPQPGDVSTRVGLTFAISVFFHQTVAGAAAASPCTKLGRQSRRDIWQEQDAD